MIWQAAIAGSERQGSNNEDGKNCVEISVRCSI